MSLFDDDIKIEPDYDTKTPKQNKQTKKKSERKKLVKIETDEILNPPNWTKKMKTEMKMEDEMPKSSTQMFDIGVQTGNQLHKRNYEMEKWSDLFGVGFDHLHDLSNTRGPMAKNISFSECKTFEELEKDINSRHENTNINANNKTKSNIDYNDFDNMNFKPREADWDCKSESLGLDNFQRCVLDALLEGKDYLTKKNSKSAVDFNSMEMDTLKPSYFADFYRRSRGEHFNERSCVNESECVMVPRLSRLCDDNKSKAWIPREFLLPREQEFLSKSDKMINELPRKPCIFCLRDTVTNLALKLKENPRSITSTRNIPHVKYVNNEPEHASLFVIQDHAVAVKNEPDNSDAYIADKGILQPDPQAGLIGPYRKFDFNDFRLGKVVMPIDFNNTMAEIPILIENNTNFF